MNNKVVLITGCSTGIGYATAIEFEKAGYKVFATIRNLNKSAMLKDSIASGNLNITVLKLDVQKSETIDACIQEIITAEGSIDFFDKQCRTGFYKVCITDNGRRS